MRACGGAGGAYGGPGEPVTPQNRQVPRAASSQEKGHEGWDQLWRKNVQPPLEGGSREPLAMRLLSAPCHTQNAPSPLFMEHPNNHAGR